MSTQKTKHSHTVQRAYLQNFSIEENGKFFLWRLDKTTGIKKRLPIDKVSVENYFYPQNIEDWLANNIEREGIKVIQKIMKDRSISNLNSKDKEKLAGWLLVQDVRTTEYRNDLRQGFEMITKSILERNLLGEVAFESLNEFIEEDPIKNIQFSMMKRFERYAPIIASDYHWMLIENNTGFSYYTSDHPVMKGNSYLKSLEKIAKQKLFGSGMGLFSKGIELHLPLNPELKLVILNLEPLDDFLREIWTTIEKNPHLYPIFWRLFPHDKIKELRSDKLEAVYDNILHSNDRITGLSNRFIYSIDNNFEIAEDLLEREPEFRNENRRRWMDLERL